MSRQNFEMVRGNDFAFNVAITLAGAPYNITTSSLRFIAKSDYSDADIAAIINLTVGSGITILNGPAGSAQIIIPRSNTVVASIPTNYTIDLFYELQVNNGGTTLTPLHGILTIIPSVSQTTP